MRLLTIALLVLTGCGPSGPDAITQVRMTRDEILADRIRRLANCQAQAVELSSMPGNTRQIALDGCLDAHQTMLAMEQITLQALDRRITELSR